MFIPASHVRRCLDQARRMAEQYRQYHLVGDHDRKSIVALMEEIVAGYLQKTFHVHKLPIPHGTVSAMFWAKNDGAYEIFLLEGLDELERRYTLCKELFHIILDEEDCHSVDVASHVAEVNATFPVADSSPSAAVIQEFLADAAAMEFMFPFSKREAFLRAAAATNKDPDWPAASRQFGIPEGQVQAYCSAPYMEYFGAFRE